jgi:hypothetical protein
MNMVNSILEPHDLPADFVPQRVNGVYTLKPGESISLMDHAGAGCIGHISLSMQPKNLRQLVLRFYWDDETEPSVECPVSDFFGIGHDQTTVDFSSMYFYVAPKYGYNCYIPMPFSRRAHITLTNDGPALVAGIYLQINFRQFNQPLEIPWRLHASWRRVFPAYRRGANFNLMEAKGNGRLIGVIYHCVKRDSTAGRTAAGIRCSSTEIRPVPTTFTESAGKTSLTTPGAFTPAAGRIRDARNAIRCLG